MSSLQVRAHGQAKTNQLWIMAFDFHVAPEHRKTADSLPIAIAERPVVKGLTDAELDPANLSVPHWLSAFARNRTRRDR